MIQEITAALWKFWRQFELNGEEVIAYQSGAVPSAAAFPYVTFDAPRAETMGTLPLTAVIWCRHDGDNVAPAIAQRLAFWEAVEKALPDGGVTLPLSIGFLMLRRGSGDFLYPVTDEEDNTVLGGRVGYEVTYYTT